MTVQVSATAIGNHILIKIQGLRDDSSGIGLKDARRLIKAVSSELQQRTRAGCTVTIEEYRFGHLFELTYQSSRPVHKAVLVQISRQLVPFLETWLNESISRTVRSVRMNYTSTPRS